MKRFKSQIFIGAALISASALLSLLHWLIFKDAKTLLFYVMEDVVFLPIQVLLVTLVLEGFLSNREKRAILEKLNMVVEVFFSEAGTELIRRLAVFDAGWAEYRVAFCRLDQWTEQEFKYHRNRIRNLKLDVDCNTADLDQLRQFMLSKREFLLQLLGNPNLLEHEAFTELLWAVFHLAEELAHRTNCREICEADRKHFIVDIERAYAMLVYEWLGYMKHLKEKYPYLFSLAMRTNPFNPEGRAELNADTDED